MSENIQDQLSLIINEILDSNIENNITSIINKIEESLFNEQYALLFEALPLQHRLLIWNKINSSTQSKSFLYFKKETRLWFLHVLDDEKCFELLEQLDLDAVLEVAEEIPGRFLKYAIEHLDEVQKKLYLKAQQYNTNQLGHWVDYNYVRISEKLKISSAKRLINKGLHPYTDEFYTVNNQGELTGTVSVNKILEAQETQSLSELIETNFITLSSSMDLNAACDSTIMSKKMAIAVCDDNKVLMGRITSALAYEIKESLQIEKESQSGGLKDQEGLFSSISDSVKNRGIWLGINLLTAFLASAVIGLFNVTLQQVVLLAVLMPIVASMGGISGSQTLTLIVRGLALGQITQSNLKALLIKELKVGVANGVIWSLIIGVITFLWFKEFGISFVLAIAIFGNLITASVSGVIIPTILNKLKIDPALSGAVLLTTMTDVIGFFIFLGLGSLFLM